MTTRGTVVLPFRGAVFDILRDESTRTELVIRDAWPVMPAKDRGRTVTNDVENVVSYLYRAGILPGTRALWYYDSEGTLDQIIHDGAGHFIQFNPGYGRIR